MFIGNLSLYEASAIGLSSPDVNDRKNRISSVIIKDYYSSLGIITLYTTFVRFEDCYILNCVGKLVLHTSEIDSIYFDKVTFTTIKPSYEDDKYIKLMNAYVLEHEEEIKFVIDCNESYRNRIKTCKPQNSMFYNFDASMLLVIILL